MDFERQGFDADSMAKFVFERTDIQVSLYLRSLTYRVMPVNTLVEL